MICKIVLFCCIAGCVQFAVAQHSIKLKITDLEENEPIPNVLIQWIDSAAVQAFTDSNGLAVFDNMPFSKYTFRISRLGYFDKKVNYTFSEKTEQQTETYSLESKEAEIEEVVVVSTRAEQKMENLPLRLEVVNQEEVEERSLDKPADISHAVKEQPGIQLQRTSANSGFFNVRLLGLRGKYTQTLRDGQPLFGGLSQNISLTQLATLDVNQIEIIKGPSSTLYGGDAIAGALNIISKTPDRNKTERTVLLNVESTKSFDAGVFWLEKFNKIGVSFTGQYRNQQAKDWDKDNFSDQPKLYRYSFQPTLFFYISPKITLKVSANFTQEVRKGGAMKAVNNIADTSFAYLEKNQSLRAGYNINLRAILSETGTLNFKSSFGYYNRLLSISSYQFGGAQLASLNELNYRFLFKKHDLILGVDFRTDIFNEKNTDTLSAKRSYKLLTPGFFAQEIFTVTKNTVLEAGLRLDYNTTFGFFGLPHISWLQKWSEVFSSKLNFGMGYKLPTIFQDESEEANYKNVLPISKGTKAETSYGGSLDFTVKPAPINGFQFSLNEMFFVSHIRNPLIAEYKTMPDYTLISFKNATGFIQGIGLETGLKMAYRGVNFNFGYTLQDQNRYLNKVKSVAPLTSKHIVSFLLGYEWAKRFSIGTDVYYYSPQQLSTGVSTNSIWEFGLNAQVFTKYVTFFANLENILDIRQSRFGPVVYQNPTYNQPRFAEIYAPLEGRLFNIGVKVKLAEIGKD